MKASLDICNESRLIRLSQVDNGSCVAANAGQIEMTSRSKNNEPTCPIAAECIAREGGGKRSFEQDALETTRRSAVMVESPGCGVSFHWQFHSTTTTTFIHVTHQHGEGHTLNETVRHGRSHAPKLPSALLGAPTATTVFTPPVTA